MMRLLSLGFVLLAFSPTFSADWTRFRGPNGQGIAPEGTIPTRWPEGDSLAWKVAVPHEGWSSPVISQGKLILTGTSDGGQACHVMAFDTATGKLLWDKEVFRQEALRKETKNSYATPTAVIEGDSVYAVFGRGGIVALSMTGEIRWTYTGVAFYSQHGLGSSPIVYQNLLIMPFDGSSPGPDKKVGWQTPWDESFILALDRTTGKEAWRAKRGMSRIAHTTPILVKGSTGDVMISQAGDVVQAFDPKNGKKLWSVKNEGEGLVPSPVLGEQGIYTTPGWPKPALRYWTWDQGDPSREPKMAWEHTKTVPMMPSLILRNGRLYGVTEKGIGICYDAKTGAVIWQERFPGTYSASLVAAGETIVAIAETGDAMVFPASAEFAPIQRNKLEGSYQATPAIAENSLFIRSDKHLYRFGR